MPLSSVDVSSAKPWTDPLHPATGLFPLGRPFGLLPVGTGTTRPGALPFGLRFAIVQAATPIGALSSYGYDHSRQIGVIDTKDGPIPLARHTTGTTKTTTNPDGRKGPDSDSDARED